MEMMTIQQAFEEKSKQQSRVKNLEYHASGHCVHIGKISPGCKRCYVNPIFYFLIPLGGRCNCDCAYCPSHEGEWTLNDEKIRSMKFHFMKKSFLVTESEPQPIVAFTGGGEPLLHSDALIKIMRSLRDVEQNMKRKPWYYLYTNGLVADENILEKLHEIGLNEIRFHLGASNFSKKAYKNMELASKYIDTIAVETPSWPPHREKLLQMLPILEDLGVKHVNMGEVFITDQNEKAISEALPDASVYVNQHLHLYDEGLVYKIMAEVAERGYSYSVLDCSSSVKQIQIAQGRWVFGSAIEGLFTE